MKKISILMAALVLFIGFSFASPISSLRQTTPAKTDKTDKTAAKKDDKKTVKKVPAKKKPDTKDQKAATTK